MSLNPEYYLSLLRHDPIYLVLIAADIWLIADAIRRDEWMWAAFIFFFPGLGAIWYFFNVYRASPSSGQGFELPGAGSRKRIKELEALIHNLDKPHHYLELGDIYFRKGNWAKAEANYRASLERDPKDIDARAHLGQCLLRQKKPQEAYPLLYEVCAENPKHDYGYSMMAYAESLAALNKPDESIAVWQEVLRNNNYARARVQLGELYLAKGQTELAQLEFRSTINDDRHAPGFQRKRDRWWIWKAKRLAK